MVVVAGAAGDARTVLRRSPVGVRRAAKIAPLPAYPAETLHARRQGLVVVSLTIGPDGRVLNAQVLETFDAAASASALSAVERWQFETLAEEHISERYPRQGEVLFQFAIRGGLPRVVDLAAEELAKERLQGNHDARK
jgi:TonB family protein